MNPYLTRVALITGASRRIGAVIAQKLHKAGYRVVIHYFQSHSLAQSLADLLNQQRPDSAALVCGDFNKFSDLELIVAQTLEKWNRLDVLVNNASSFYPTAVGHTTELQWMDLINTNLKAPYFLAQAAMKSLTAQRGCIVNITDIHGQRPLKNYPVYSIAKAGLTMLTQALAREFAPEVRVNAIAPGVTLLPETVNEDIITRLKAKTLLKHFPCPEDIAEAVLFLIGQTAITGQIINIDAGRSLRQ